MGKIITGSKTWAIKDLETMSQHITNAYKFILTPQSFFKFEKDKKLNNRITNSLRDTRILIKQLIKRIKEND